VALRGNVRAVDLVANKSEYIAGAFVQLDVSGEAPEPNTDVRIVSNDVYGASQLVRAGAGSFVEPLLARGNRAVQLQRPAMVNDAAATINARGNWWGHNGGLTAAEVSGAVAVDDPLRLQIDAAPAQLTTRGSAVIVASLRVPGAPKPEETAWQYSATFGSSATLSATTVAFKSGAVRSVLRAPSTAGVVVTTVRLDDVTLTVRTTVRAIIPPSSGGTGAGGGTVGAQRAPFRADSQIHPGSLLHARSHPLAHLVSTNRVASVQTTVAVDFHTAQLLGLRPSWMQMRELFIIGRAESRPMRGVRYVHVDLSERARYVLARSSQRVAVLFITRIQGSNAEEQRVIWRRGVISAMPS